MPGKSIFLIAALASTTGGRLGHAEDVVRGEPLRQVLRSHDGLDVEITATQVWRGHRGLSGENGYEDIRIRAHAPESGADGMARAVLVTRCYDVRGREKQPALVESIVLKPVEGENELEATVARLPGAYDALGVESDYACETELAFEVNGLWHKDPWAADGDGNFRLALRAERDDSAKRLD